jgi:radical SAM protein with 4Fe4S-binding SPASM domain
MKHETQSTPEIFAIETILGCNLKCPECAIGGNYVSRKKGWMTFTQFKSIADKIRPYCKYLYLHIWGEPMLNNDIYQMIEYASTFTRTNISTNGKSMTDKNAEMLIRSGVNDIIVSIDGVSQNVYEKYRVGGSVQKAINSLKMLQYFNQKYGNKVHIIPQFIVMKHNHHEMNSFCKLTESIGLRPLFKSPYIRNSKSCFSNSDDPRFQRPCYPDLTSLKKAMRECGSVRNDFNVLVDGTVVACCHDYDSFTNFGNIFEQNVLDIWNSEKYKRFRWNVMSGKPPQFCIKHCMSYFLDPTERNANDRCGEQLFVENTGKILCDNQKEENLHFYNQFHNKIYPDEVHLEACMQWLAKAQDMHTDVGVFAKYNIASKKWDKEDYFEITGCIIPSFLCYAKLTGKDTYIKRAINLGDFEITKQTPDGSARTIRVAGELTSSILKTAQIIIGWLALYEETGSTKYINAAIKAANWVLKNQDEDGKWIKYAYYGPKAYHSKVAWALLELYAITKNDEYRISVERSLDWILAQANDNAWFRNNSVSEPEKSLTQLIGYVLVGLLEIYRMNFLNPQFISLLNQLTVAASHISRIYIHNKSQELKTLPGTINCKWNSSDSWSCNTGNAQIEFFLRRLFRYYKEPLLITVSDMLLNDLKTCHLIDGITDPNAYGGLPGSYPIYGPYQNYAIPNWGVKFFADSLLQRLLPENKQKFLG